MNLSVNYSLISVCLSLSGCLAKVSNIVVFGDSYSDVDNGHQSSNGPVWSQHLAVGWNSSLYSFAYSGATCERSASLNNDKSSTTPSIVDQVEMYYNQHLDLNPDETVYAFWVGQGDIYELIQTNNNDYGNLVDCIMHQMRNIRKLFGSNRYIMFTLAPTESMPFFSDKDKMDEMEQYKQAVDNFNERLHEKVYNMVRRHQSLELDLVDTHDLLKDMSNSPIEFGFKDGHHSFWDTCVGQCNDTVDDYVWWDKVHLTGGAHRVIANSILISDSMEPSDTIDPSLIAGNSSVSTYDLIHSPVGSRFKSPHFTAHQNTGLMDRLVKELDAKKASSGDTVDEDWIDEDDNMWIRPFPLITLLSIFLCIVCMFYNRRAKGRGGNLKALSGLVRNRNSDRGQFTPLDSIESSSNSV